MNNKFTAVLLIGLGMLVSTAGMASDDEVTIRVMEMHENTKESVMQMIALPDSAGDTARLKTKSKDRTRETIRVEDENQQIREMEQTREREMEQENERDMDEIQNEVENSHEDVSQESEQAEENQQNPGNGNK